MSKAWTSLSVLSESGILKESSASLEEVADHFQIRVSPLMQQKLLEDHSNAIYSQFIPSTAERKILPDEVDDPIGDYPYTPVEGIVHRYQDRALLKITQLCAVYCRFCFRKEMIGKKGQILSEKEIEHAISYIQAHSELWEIILTGGDPLILSSNRLLSVMKRVSEIPHIKVIRIHTRIPVVSPERVDDELLKGFEEILKLGISLYIAIHANHADEFSLESFKKLKQLHQLGIVLISQSVMLRGVNDNFEALSELMRTFVMHHVKPYYLHQMDFARGTSHFRVPEERAVELIRELRLKLSGICIPTLIQEIPGGKKPLF